MDVGLHDWDTPPVMPRCTQAGCISSQLFLVVWRTTSNILSKSFVKITALVAQHHRFPQAIHNELMKFADETPGIDQYSIRAFATALEVGPRTLAEVSGHKGSEVIPALVAAHSEGKKLSGINIETGVVEETVVRDAYLTRFWAMQLACDAVQNVLRVCLSMGWDGLGEALRLVKSTDKVNAFLSRNVVTTEVRRVLVA